MANNIVVWLILSIFLFPAFAEDKIYLPYYLGEKKTDLYFERYYPAVFHEPYLGKISFKDDIFFQNYLSHYISSEELELSRFLKNELKSGMLCPDEVLKNHSNDIRFSYRLITLSYLLEAQSHMHSISEKMKLKNTCAFDLRSWVSKCNPKTNEMKKLVSRLAKFNPSFESYIPSLYNIEDWMKDFKEEVPKYYSHHRMKNLCRGNCLSQEIETRFGFICESNLKLLNLICSEEDEIFGLSQFRDAYSLIGQSNIINTYNKSGEALGCLRKYSEIYSHREGRYPALNSLFPGIQDFLRVHFKERFLQGRAFIYGANKEFEEKGLERLFVESKKFSVETIKEEPETPKVSKQAEVLKKSITSPGPKKVMEQIPKKEIVEIKDVIKSAFLQAAEARRLQRLKEVEVDMLKLKYDYVFTLNMLNKLSKRLKMFMSREALEEMANFDKLGTIDAPVPLLFLKYMIDMQEHQGLWNIVSVLSENFYVSNEIDADLKPDPELIKLQYNTAVAGNWQIYILEN